MLKTISYQWLEREV